MKSSKTDQIDGKVFQKTFLVDNDEDALSATAEIEQILHLRGKFEREEPLFLDPKTRNELTIAKSRRKLAEKVANVCFAGTLHKGTLTSNLRSVGVR